MTETWKERMELAERRCSEIIDLDQDPPVKYINIRATAAQAELEDLDKLHKDLLLLERQKLLSSVREKVIGDPCFICLNDDELSKDDYCDKHLRWLEQRDLLRSLEGRTE